MKKDAKQINKAFLVDTNEQKTVEPTLSSNVSTNFLTLDFLQIPYVKLKLYIPFLVNVNLSQIPFYVASYQLTPFFKPLKPLNLKQIPFVLNPNYQLNLTTIPYCVLVLNSYSIPYFLATLNLLKVNYYTLMFSTIPYFQNTLNLKQIPYLNPTFIHLVPFLKAPLILKHIPFSIQFKLQQIPSFLTLNLKQTPALVPKHLNLQAVPFYQIYSTPSFISLLFSAKPITNNALKLRTRHVSLLSAMWFFSICLFISYLLIFCVNTTNPSITLGFFSWTILNIVLVFFMNSIILIYSIIHYEHQFKVMWWYYIIQNASLIFIGASLNGYLTFNSAFLGFEFFGISLCFFNVYFMNFYYQYYLFLKNINLIYYRLIHEHFLSIKHQARTSLIIYLLSIYLWASFLSSDVYMYFVSDNYLTALILGIVAIISSIIYIASTYYLRQNTLLLFNLEQNIILKKNTKSILFYNLFALLRLNQFDAFLNDSVQNQNVFLLQASYLKQKQK